MKPRRETEVKLRVESPRRLGRKLSELGFAPVSARHFERNILFDFKGSPLRRAGSLIRLRFEGSRGLVTFKGASRRSSRYKVRPEIETTIEDCGALRAIFERLGLR